MVTFSKQTTSKNVSKFFHSLFCMVIASDINDYKGKCTAPKFSVGIKVSHLHTTRKIGNFVSDFYFDNTGKVRVFLTLCSYPLIEHVLFVICYYTHQ